jgi:hypothetical protein
MAKQVRFRRGDTSQIAGFTGAEGEITYDTTKKTLVVHDGATAGGFELARLSAVPNVFTTIAVSGQSNVVADGYSDTLTFIAGAGIGLTTNASTDSVTISATGDVQGSIFADDSTLLVDGLSGKLVGPVQTNYDVDIDGNNRILRFNGTGNHQIGSLGSLELSVLSAIDLTSVSGKVTLTSTGIDLDPGTGNVVLLAGVLQGNVQGTVTGSLVGTHDGDVTGSVFADNSTLLVDAVNALIPAAVVQGTFTGNVVGNVTGNVTGNVAGNTSGFHDGDVSGSVFADDSTLLVDAVNGRCVTGDITFNSGTIIRLTSNSNITLDPPGTGEITTTGILRTGHAIYTTALDIAGLSTGNVTLTADQLTSNLITASPVGSTRDLIIPNAGVGMSGIKLLIRNRSGSQQIRILDTALNVISSVSANSTLQIACDGYSWFLV